MLAGSPEDPAFPSSLPPGYIGQQTSLLSGQQKIVQGSLADDEPLARSYAHTRSPHLRGPAATLGGVSRPVKSLSGPVFPDDEAEQAAAFPRVRMTLLISLLCFLASLISGGAAIWLAVTRLH
jgi:hypothetical protein